MPCGIKSTALLVSVFFLLTNKSYFARVLADERGATMHFYLLRGIDKTGNNVHHKIIAENDT